MITGGFPDYLSFTRRTRLNADLKSRIDVTTKEAITGKRADLTQATNGRVGGAHLMLKAINDIQQENRVNTMSKLRLDLIGQGLSGARDIVQGIDSRAIIAVAANSDVGIQTVQSEAEASLRNVMNALSINQGPRNLLSGDATDQPTFADADVLLDDIRAIMTSSTNATDAETALNTYFNDPAGGFQTRIYTGGDNNPPAVRIGADDKIDVDIKGDDTAIKDVLKGLAVLAASSSSNFEQDSQDFADIFTLGANAAGQGSQDLIRLEANIGVYADTILKSNERNEAELTSLSAAYQTLTGRDQFEAATELKQLEAQLESSFLLTARLSNLSLTNFLR